MKVLTLRDQAQTTVDDLAVPLALLLTGLLVHQVTLAIMSDTNRMSTTDVLLLPVVCIVLLIGTLMGDYEMRKHLGAAAMIGTGLGYATTLLRIIDPF